MDHNEANLTDLDRLVLAEYPYPIAVWYRRMLTAPSWEDKARAAVRLFDFGMRTLALGLISQYVLYDAKDISDDTLNALIKEKFPHAVLGIWKNIFFSALRAYKGHRDRFFMQELYDLYWDTSKAKHRPRRDVEEPYNTVIRLRNEHVAEHEFGVETEEEWRVVAEEMLTALEEILKEFSFLQKYDLIYIELKHPDGEYTYTVYKGEHPTQRRGLLHSGEALEEGIFYLSESQEDFLRLYPMFIFWEAPPDERHPNKVLTDIAIYSTLAKTTVTYVAAVLRKNITQKDPDLVGAFVRMLHESIDEATEDHIEVEELTWEVLREAAGKVSARRFNVGSEKYRRELYLQRQEVKVAFDDFLVSDKTAFLLLGKSGVGKSSFFMSMTDELREAGNICLIMYDGGGNLETDRPLLETISRSFRPYLRLMEGKRKRTIDDILDEVNNIDGIESHRVVLFIDAINENAEAKELLRRIDALVESAYPWLKIVISSRPEAWRAIRRGIKLSEHLYYSVQGRQELGVELQSFTVDTETKVGVEMKNFSRLELPEVYEKYRQAYDLQTSYEELKREIRLILNDPLTLKLVAEIHPHKRIPEFIQPGEIYAQYIEQLKEDRRLTPADVAFLEDDLMPLMISNGHYDNKITAEQANTEITASGRELLDLIHNDALLSDDRQVNQSFKNLVDTEILVMKGTSTDYEISFKYERFYDYFGGKRLYELASETDIDLYAFFLDMIRMTGKQAAPAQSTSQR